MAQIRLEKVGFGYIQTLFQNVTMSITEHDRIGIVGHNGSGKSSLLHCIAGRVAPQEGRVIAQKGMTFGFIEQEIPKNLLDRTLYDVLLDALPEQDKHAMSWKVDVALDTFGASSALYQQSIKQLSGGWQRLALIARVALSHPDLLLLDEPTNHLDVEKIDVLERWLNEQVYDIPFVSISHDRAFLAHCTNKTFFLRNQEVIVFNYAYDQAVELLREQDKASFVKRTKETKEMNRLKRSAHELRQIGVNNYSAAALKKSIQIAKRAHVIEKQLSVIPTEEKRSLKLSHSDMHAKIVIALNKVSIFSPDKSLLFQIDKLDIKQGDRLIILGENGSGKSQFMKYIYQSNQDTNKAREAGIHITPTVNMGYIDQHLSQLPGEQRLHDYFNHLLSLGDQKTTSVLVNAGFPIPLQRTKLEQLSQGQRVRAAFLTLHLLKPNFYLLDEPTNHLDIAGQEQLETEIIEQGAASIVVSHDRRLVQTIGTRFYAIQDKKLIETDPDMYWRKR